MEYYQRKIAVNNLWPLIIADAKQAATRQPILASFYYDNILAHDSFSKSLAYILASRLAPSVAETVNWQQLLLAQLDRNQQIEAAATNDLLCQLETNASIKDHLTPLLYFAGFHALQTYRLAHQFWHNGDVGLATYMQSRAVFMFGVDIHPAAQLGSGIFIDHAQGIVIGETAVVEDQVTIFQNVTLGSTGKVAGDRHPKIRTGALLGSGASVLGNIEVGAFAKVGAGALVLRDVPAKSCVVAAMAERVERAAAKVPTAQAVC